MKRLERVNALVQYYITTSFIIVFPSKFFKAPTAPMVRERANRQIILGQSCSNDFTLSIKTFIVDIM